jgi:hypothetical protein
MSAGIAPMPRQLAQELEPVQHELEARLECLPAKTNINPEAQETLYQWAGEMIEQLMQDKKLGEPEAKKRLAEVLGVTTDPRWRGRTKIPLRGNTPRHRVVARLAREKRWHALWSLNWDCVLETALESVGMPLHPKGSPPKKQPWPEWHRTWTQPEELPPLDDSSTTLVIKPHGCSRKLINGDCTTFKVTAIELADVGMNEDKHKAMVKKHFSVQPLLTCGWGASEEYLRQWFSKLSQDQSIPAESLDPLSIIDINPDQPNHIEIASAYGINPPEPAQVKVDTDNCTTDELFLWIQTRFGLNHLRILHNPPFAELETLLAQAALPRCNHWLNGWFDNFLPIWVRLCCNTGITQFFVNAGPINSDAIPTDRRDEHIPWSYQEVARPDLKMATQLLLQLAKDNIGERWDTSRFPGGLWDKESRRLIMPLPCSQLDQPPSLSALRAMTESHHWERKGDIMHLDILLHDQNGSIIPNANFSEALRQTVGKLMKHSRLADYRNIGIVDFSALKEAAT